MIQTLEKSGLPSDSAKQVVLALATAVAPLAKQYMLEEVKEDVAAVKEDVATVKEDVAVLKADVGWLKWLMVLLLFV